MAPEGSVAPDGSARRRPSVLFAVHSTHLGGGEILAYQTARWLSRSGHRLTIAAPEGPLHGLFADTGQLVAPTPMLPTWGATAVRWATDMLRTFRDVPRLRRVIRDTGTDVVLTNTSTTLAPVIAARLERVPVVVHVREWPTSRLATPLVRLHARIATTVVVIAEPLLATAARGPGRARLVHIHDGIQPGRFSVRPPRVPGGRLRLAVVGGFDRRKGQDIAIRALARLRDAGFNAELDLVGRQGRSDYMEELAQLIEGLDLRDRVHNLGERRDVPMLMHEWDAMLAPSRGEWTPLAIMEAMAVGLPVVAASVGAVADLLDHGTCGRLIRPDDVEGLADAIMGVIAESGTPEAAARATAARRRVLERYDLEPSLARLGAELARVAPGARAGG
jgi:glycosyltransferase involved in cell wall biosynthesis